MSLDRYFYNVFSDIPCTAGPHGFRLEVVVVDSEVMYVCFKRSITRDDYSGLEDL